MSQAIEEAVESSRPLIEKQGHQLTVNLPTQPILVDADQTRLAQVFLNLLNNAAKFSERGGRIDLTASGRVMTWWCQSKIRGSAYRPPIRVLFSKCSLKSRGPWAGRKADSALACAS